MKPSFLIAATSSGCGKTTLSLGLMRAITKRGKSVRPFKCGPDYIDTQFHAVATGSESINLDLFMSSEDHVQRLFSHYSADADVCIVEGVMGMFDGYDKMSGSSAHLAQVLDIPVILLINAASAAYSVAATIYGFSQMNKDVKVKGVIFNRVASERHFSFLKDACQDVGVKCYGYIQRNEQLQTPSRHLGLTLQSRQEMDRFIDLAADEVGRHVNIDELLSDTSVSIAERELSFPQNPGLTVAVARDEAFNFVYPVNLEAFGGEIKYFSPLHDDDIPDADIIYLPGGYPELFAEQIECNQQIRLKIKQFAESGGRILAECGGLIYLTDEIDGRAMCGILPLKTTMQGAKLTLGYRCVAFKDISLKGHEFHYSHIENPSEQVSIAAQTNAKGLSVNTPVYRYKNTIAGYTHLYWGESDILKIWNE